MPDVIDKNKTALVVIDLQKGIVALQTAPYDTKSVIANAAKLTSVFRQYNMPVFLVHVGPSNDKKDSLHPEVDQSMTPSTTMPNDWMEIVPELAISSTDFIITKRQWGAFYGTELDLQLRRRGVDTIILCGISTNVGVESTARFAYEYGYTQFFVEDACSARSAIEHEHSINYTFPKIGKVRSTEDILKILNN